ncbi:MAG TPA: ECF transporter S component [Candidatus Methylomirabilis sp.]|jgi:hypothetical protein
MTSASVAVSPLIRTRSAALALVVAAQALPWLVHLVHLPGPMLLPMQFAAVLAGLALGPLPGLLNGLAAPVVSFLLTGLPPAGLVPLMAVEVATYGAVAGFLAQRTAWRGAWIVLATLVAGRLALLPAAAMAGPALGLKAPALSFVLNAALAGWPGIALQLVALSLAARVLAPVDRR